MQPSAEQPTTQDPALAELRVLVLLSLCILSRVPGGITVL